MAMCIPQVNQGLNEEKKATNITWFWQYF